MLMWKKEYDRRECKGFTLIELLLGLMIFSMISVTVYSVFWGGIKLDNQAEVQNQALREVRWTFALLERELVNMVPYDFSSFYPEKMPFDSKDDKITFLLVENDELKVVQYFLQDPARAVVVQTIMGETYSRNVKIEYANNQELREAYLIRAEQSFVDYLNDKPFLPEDQEIIAMHIKENGIRFFFGVSSPENTGEVSWVENWDFPYIPSYIKIEADFVLSRGKESIKTFTKKILVPVGFIGSEDDENENASR